MSGYAWVTLTTNDSYSLGALVLAHSLKQAGTTHQLAVLVTPGVTPAMREKLASVFNVVQEVNILDSKDESNLRLLKRPELGITFTKLHCWRLTQFEKCVFLDADTLALRNADELFEREEFSAAPDVGWPDCFNTGVFVYRPSNETFEKLIQFALEKGSFDGGDQGLLNLYFSNWAHQDINKHLPFIYNMCSTACYSYLPAFKQYGKDAKIVHFIGATKPWLQFFNMETKQVQPSGDIHHLQPILQHWWDIFCTLIHPNLSTDMSRNSRSDENNIPITHSQQPEFKDSSQLYTEVWDPWEEYENQQTHNTESDPSFIHISSPTEEEQLAFSEVEQISSIHNLPSPNISNVSLQDMLCVHPEINPVQESAPSFYQNPREDFVDSQDQPLITTPPDNTHVNNTSTDTVEHASASQLMPEVCTVTNEINSENNDSEEDTGGLAGAFAQITLGSPKTAIQTALEDHMRRQAWESGNIDYMDKDSFDSIWKRITETLAAGPQQQKAHDEYVEKTEVIQEAPKESKLPERPVAECPKKDADKPAECPMAVKDEKVTTECPLAQKNKPTECPLTKKDEKSVECPLATKEGALTECPLAKPVECLEKGLTKVCPKDEKPDDSKVQEKCIECPAANVDKAEEKCTECPKSAEPIQSTEAKPEEKLVETKESKPAESTETRPAESTGAKPADIAEAKPAEIAEAKPAGTIEAKPAETAEAKPVDSAEVKPVETAEAKPAECPAAKSAECTEVKPAECPTAKLVECSQAKPEECPAPKKDEKCAECPSAKTEEKCSECPLTVKDAPQAQETTEPKKPADEIKPQEPTQKPQQESKVDEAKSEVLKPAETPKPEEVKPTEETKPQEAPKTETPKEETPKTDEVTKVEAAKPQEEAAKPQEKIVKPEEIKPEQEAVKPEEAKPQEKPVKPEEIKKEQEVVKPQQEAVKPQEIPKPQEVKQQEGPKPDEIKQQAPAPEAAKPQEAAKPEEVKQQAPKSEASKPQKEKVKAQDSKTEEIKPVQTLIAVEGTPKPEEVPKPAEESKTKDASKAVDAKPVDEIKSQETTKTEEIKPVKTEAETAKPKAADKSKPAAPAKPVKKTKEGGKAKQEASKKPKEEAPKVKQDEVTPAKEVAAKKVEVTPAKDVASKKVEVTPAKEVAAKKVEEAPVAEKVVEKDVAEGKEGEKKKEGAKKKKGCKLPEAQTEPQPSSIPKTPEITEPTPPTSPSETDKPKEEPSALSVEAAVPETPPPTTAAPVGAASEEAPKPPPRKVSSGKKKTKK